MARNPNPRIYFTEVVQPETALAQDCQLAHFVLTIEPVVLTFPLMYDCQHQKDEQVLVKVLMLKVC
jgi:hypothetical protein